MRLLIKAVSKSELSSGKKTSLKLVIISLAAPENLYPLTCLIFIEFDLIQARLAQVFNETTEINLGPFAGAALATAEIKHLAFGEAR